MANTKKAKGFTPSVTDTPYTPFVIDTTAPTVDEERIVAFVIDGVEHTMPKKLPACDILRGLEILATGNQFAFTKAMVLASLGEESFKALLACRQVTQEQVTELFGEISKLYFGQVSDVAGK